MFLRRKRYRVQIQDCPASHHYTPLTALTPKFSHKKLFVPKNRPFRLWVKKFADKLLQYVEKVMKEII